MNFESFDMDYTIDIMKTILTTPSPTGNTEQVLSKMQEAFEHFGLTTQRIHKGGLIATLKGRCDDVQRTVSAHVDTLGAMVKEIKSSGRLKLTNLGGYMWNAVEGEYCTIMTDEGKTYSGTILTTKASTHVYGAKARELPREENNMEIRIDEKVKSKEDVLALGIEVGNFVSFDPRTEVTASGFIKSRHLDDKVSAATLVGVVKYLVENKIELPYTTNFFITNYEEVGHGASYGIPKQTKDLLAVDMGCVGDGLNGSEYIVSICAKDSSGPYDYTFRKTLKKLAEENNIDYCIDIFPHYGSDASAALRAGNNIRHALIGVGVDASHAYERAHIDGVWQTAKLILAYLLSE